MSYQYIESPDDVEVLNKESIFLIGGISGCEDWQQQIKELISINDKLTTINPRRKDFNEFKEYSGYKQSEDQISWEFDRIKNSTQLLFWFGGDTIQPISLFHFGTALERNKKYFNKIVGGQQIFVGIDPNYERSFDLYVQMKLFNYTANISDNIEQLAAHVNSYNRNLGLFF